MSDNTQPLKSARESDTTKASRYLRWRDEITKAEKELEKFHDKGQKVVKRYLDDRGDSFTEGMRKFNIFTANVGILQSVLYANIPKVRVSRKFNQFGDEPARLASYMLQNALMQDMEERDCDFDQTMREAVEDRLVPGVGCAWVRLETDTEEKTLEEVTDPLTGEVISEAATYEQITEQEVCIEHVHWSDFIWSPCRTWSECRWVARRVYMTYDALVDRFGEELARKIPLDYKPDDAKDGTGNTPENEVFEQAIIYEIWDSQTEKVLWLSKGYTELLDEKDDPLELDGFFPCPKPLFALTSTSKCVPVSDYVIYQDQYEELDQINNRISLLVAACKVVGVYDTSSQGVQKMLQEAYENTLVPVDNWAMFAEKGGLKGVVDWLPLDTVIQALDKLRQAREDIKGQIYELTGISDIVRGNTKASETLGAQKIKAQFASTRIQKLQDEVARFAQDILRIKAEIICRHFDPRIIFQLSNIQYSPDVLNQQLVQQALQLLKNEDAFEWRVKVQADSLGQTDYDEQKQEKVEFTNAVATFLQSAATTLKALPSAAPIVFETLKYAVSGFKGSQELEGVIDQGLQAIMADIAQQKQQAQNQPNPMQMKLQVEQQKAQGELQIKKAELQMDQQAQQADLAMKQQEHQQDMAFKAQEHQMNMAQQADKADQQIVLAQQKAMQQMVADARKDRDDGQS